MATRNRPKPPSRTTSSSSPPASAGLPGLLKEGFRWRRKTLRKAFPAARLEAAGIDPGARPQEVAPDAWVRLLTVPPV